MANDPYTTLCATKVIILARTLFQNRVAEESYHKRRGFTDVHILAPILVAARSKTWVCGRWLAGIAGSNRRGHECLCCEIEISATS